MAFVRACPRVNLARRVWRSRLATRLCVFVRWSLLAACSGAPRAPALRRAGARQVPLRDTAPPRSTTVAGLPRANTSGSSSTAIRRAPSGRTPSSGSPTPTSASARPSPPSWRSRIPRVPVVLPDARARRLRAVQAGDDAFLPDARAGAGPDRDARGDRRTDDVHAALSGQQAACRRRRAGCARRATASACTSTGVGVFYYRQRWYPGAIDRFNSLLKSDPGFTYRDGIYYYLAQIFLKADRSAEALPYLDRLVKEFEKSEFLEDAKKQIELIKSGTLKEVKK